MPRYTVTRDTWISHQGKLARAGETVDIDWPEGAEPKGPSTNLQRVEPEKPTKPPKPAKGEGEPLA